MSSEPFPAGYEAPIILEEVKRDDRIVYFESCTCVPLLDQIAVAIGEKGKLLIVGRGGATRRPHAKVDLREGTYESVPVDDDWASLVIGECSLDEFEDARRAFREARRILAPAGRMLVSGPVRADEDIASDLLTIDSLQALLKGAGFSEVQLTDLTGPVLEELSLVPKYGSLAKLMAGKKVKFVILRVTASRGVP